MKKIRYIIFALVAPLIFGASSAAALDGSLDSCRDISSFSQRTVSVISSRALELRSVRTERLNAISARWIQQDAEKTMLREQAARIKEIDFKPLESMLADAPESHKRALVEFRSALETASKERRLAVDTANNNFRASVRELLEKRSRDFHAATVRFADSIESSLSETAAECAVGSLPVVNLRTSVASRFLLARQEFRNDPRTGSADIIELRQITVQYKANIAAATDDFKLKVTEAQAAFKAAIVI